MKGGSDTVDWRSEPDRLSGELDTQTIGRFSVCLPVVGIELPTLYEPGGSLALLNLSRP